jgi:RimJ/RimL family protein N-acetyltransferase
MQESAISTEAMYLMMSRIFDDLGYRRYEWKCDSLNQPSCRAAERLGFLFEGLFRQATLYKNRNRDTNWYSILDSEWPVIKSVFENWLKVENFDLDGKQKTSLSKTMSDALKGIR